MGVKNSMKKRTILAILIISLLLNFSQVFYIFVLKRQLAKKCIEMSEFSNNVSSVPVAVTEAETAITIVEEALFHKYGEVVYHERPFTAVFNEQLDAWHIKGHALEAPYADGPLEVWIKRKDGTIINSNWPM